MKTTVKGWVCAVSVVVLSSVAALLTGCAGLVSSANSTNTTPSSLVITNVQTGSITTASTQVIWTTNVPADSSVDFGTAPTYGSATPVNSAMVTSHQMTLSNLAAGTTYYFQVNSTDSKGNHGHGGNSFKTAGFSLSGTINPATGGSGSTLTLSGAASATATADSSGNYTVTGLANGTYTIVPSHAGYTFTPSSQSMTINGANVTGVNFTDTSAAVGADDHDAAGEPDGDGGSDGDVHGSGGRDSAARLPVAEERGEHRGGDGDELHDARNGDDRQRIDVRCGGEQYGRDGDEQRGHADGECRGSSADDHHAAGESDGDGGSDGDVHGGGGRDSAARLPVAEERSEHRRGDGDELHDARNSDDGQRIDVRCGGEQHGRDGDERAATLTVNAAAVAPTITTQPVNQTVTAGATATFTVVAGGTAPLGYQWQKNGVNIAGATGTSYTTPATATTDSGSTFRVVVSNTAGTVTSSAATLTVNAAVVAPTITTQPVNQTVTAGATATFTVVAGGTAPLGYQWQKNGVNIAGATGTSYTTPATATTDSGSTFVWW